MDILKSAVRFLAALYLAYYLSRYIIGNPWISGSYTALSYVLFCFIGFYLFFLLSWIRKFILFAFMVFIPISLVFSLPFGSVVELLAPILCVFSVVEILKSGQPLFSRKAILYFIAIGVLVLLATIHYILNPVLGKITFGVGTQSGGLRHYALIFFGICTFLCSYWFFKNNEFNVDKYFLIFLIICLALGELYMIGLFTDVPLISFLKLGSHGVTKEGFQYSSIPLRIISALLTALLLSIYHNKRWGVFFILVFINIIVFMIFGGGRSSLPILALVIGSYIIFINRRYIYIVLPILMIISSIYVLVLSDLTLSEYKFGRVFKVEGGLQEQDAARYYTFLYMNRVFEKSPLIGKGIGYQQIKGSDVFFKEYPEALQHINYIEAMLVTGGHGTYMSILTVFGLGGMFWLLAFLLGGIYHCYRFIKINDGLNDHDTRVAVFVLLQLLSLAVGFYVGGAGGYEEIRFWFLAGIIAGLISKDKLKTQNQLLDSGIISQEETAQSYKTHPINHISNVYGI